MACNQVLAKQSKFYTRACDDCGIGPCHLSDEEIAAASVCESTIVPAIVPEVCVQESSEPSQQNDAGSIEGNHVDYATRYANAKGQVEREWIVEELRQDDGIHLHSLLSEIGEHRERSQGEQFWKFWNS